MLSRARLGRLIDGTLKNWLTLCVLVFGTITMVWKNGVKPWKLVSVIHLVDPWLLWRQHDTPYTTLEDDVTPTDYIQSIVLHGKNAGIATTDHAQVLLAYEHFNGELRLHLPVPTEQSTVASLIEVLNIQKNIWFNIYSRTPAPTRQNQPVQSNRPNRPFQPNHPRFGRDYYYPTGNPSRSNTQPLSSGNQATYGSRFP